MIMRGEGRGGGGGGAGEGRGGGGGGGAAAGGGGGGFIRLTYKLLSGYSNNGRESSSYSVYGTGCLSSPSLASES